MVTLKSHLRLLVFRIINFLFIVPVFRFLSLRVLDLLWWQEVPVSFKITTLHFGAIDTHFIGVIGFDNQSVEMGEFIILK